MSATFPGFVILFGLLHVCSGKTRALRASVATKTQGEEEFGYFYLEEERKL